MKLKLLIGGILISSFFGYLEWANNKTFLFQAEYLLFTKLFSDPVSVFHPFTIIPLAGQILLITSLFKKNPFKICLLIAIAAIGLLFLIILTVGVLSKNFKTIISVMPFFVFSFLTLKQAFRKAEQ